jgi:hypothetical protein
MGNRGQTVEGVNNFLATDAFYIEVYGDRNQVYGEAKNIKIHGDSNIIEAGVHDVVLINTSGLTIEESNVTYIDGKKVNPDAISAPTDVKAISASRDVELNVLTYEVDTTSGDITLTFDLSVYTYTEGQIWHFKKIVQPNNMIITVNGGTLDGAASQSFKKQYTTISVQFNGSNFIIL